ncbi:MAG: anti-sigma factor [Pseudomonadota bacterium]
MNITRNPALVDQLAASYALGTLRGGARRRFEDVARANPGVRAAALIWQSRLGSMAELQPELAPSAAVWKRIEIKLAADREARQIQRGRENARPIQPDAGGWWANLRLWRGTTAAGALAAVFAVVVGANLNTQLSGQVSELSAKLQATPEIQYVAVLADDKASASMLVTFDPKNGRLLLKRVGGFQEGADKSLQLWALPQSGGPKSLGVLAGDPVIRLPATGADVREVPALAVSLEPKGGAPAGGGPTGPVLFKGALIQTVL